MRRRHVSTRLCLTALLDVARELRQAPNLREAWRMMQQLREQRRRSAAPCTCCRPESPSERMPAVDVRVHSVEVAP